METIILIVFVLGYLGIALEHNLKIDKLIPALGMMAILWALIALTHMDVFNVDTALKELIPTHIEEILLHHLGKTAEILAEISVTPHPALRATLFPGRGVSPSFRRRPESSSFDID
jgi:hypothetical protein